MPNPQSDGLDTRTRIEPSRNSMMIRSLSVSFRPPCRLTAPGMPFASASASALRLHHQTNGRRSEEHTSELQSLMRISYAVFCLTKKKQTYHIIHTTTS